MRKNNYLFSVLMVGVVMFVLFGSGAAVQGAGDKFVLKYAGYFPPDNYVANNFEKPFMKTIEQRSNGRITFKYYPSQQLGKAGTFPDLIGQGVAQAGYIISAYFIGKKPLLGITDLPFLYDRPIKEWMRIAINMLHHPEIESVFESWNLKVVAAASLGNRCFVTKSLVNTMADLKGKQIRGSGALQTGTLKALGASPVTMSSAEVYTALSTGVVDGALISPASQLSWKWYEQAKYTLLSEPSMSTNMTPMVMNLDVWKELPKDLQDIISKAAEEQEAKNIEYFSNHDAQSVEKLKKLGVTITWLGKDEVSKWRKAVRPIWEKWVSENGAPAQRLLDSVLKQLGEK